MNEHLQRTFAICATVLLVGLVFSWVLWVSLAKFNQIFQVKDFYDRSPYTTDGYQAVRLSDKQFAVIRRRGEVVDVYQMDAKGNLSRTSGNQ